LKTLNAKIIALSFFLVLFTGITFSVQSLMQSREHIIESELANAESDLRLIGKGIESKVDEIEGDVMFLSATPPVKGLIRSQNNGGIDPRDGSSSKLWRSRLATIFKEMMHTKPEYLQIRYIGVAEEGRELVRVDRKGTRVLVTPDVDLQSKKDEFYFKDILNTDPYSVYFSPLTLNREWGKVTIPHQLVLRAAVPIYKNSKEIFGFVIVNADYSTLFSELDYKTRKDAQLMISNEEGKLLVLSDKSGKIRTQDLTANSPRIFDLDFEPGNEDFVVAHIDGEIVVSSYLSYNPSNKSQVLWMSLRFNENALQAKVENDLIKDAILLLLLSIFSLVMASVFSLKLSQPISKLMDFVGKIQSGQPLDSEFIKAIKGDDDVARLSKTVIHLSSEIIEKNNKLEFQQAALNSAALVSETDLKGKITVANSKFTEVSGYNQSELLGQDHRILNSGHHPKSFFKSMWSTIQSGNVWHGEVKNRAKDGSEYWVDTTIFPMKLASGEIDRFISIRFDITKQKNIEAALIDSNEEMRNAMSKIKEQSQMLEEERERAVNQTKLASLGQMAGGIAHEINTPLGIIKLANKKIIKTLQREGYQSEMVNEAHDLIDKTVYRINKIIQGLKSIARDSSKDDKEWTHLSSIVEDALSVCREKFKGDGVKIDVEGDLNVELLCRGGQISQVILNLLSNSFQAIKSQDKPWIKITTQSTSDYITLSVIDSGHGIKDHEKIMDPFYTTKSASEGTGLGLSISQSIATDHGGSLTYDRNYPNTKFDLVLALQTKEQVA